MLFVTALQDELEAVLKLGGGDGGGWREGRDGGGFAYHFRDILNEREQPLRIAAAWTRGMGETAAAVRAQSLIDELDPRCIAMCGICAGRRGEVSLGDVIVADLVYSYDQGKSVTKAEGGEAEYFHEVKTHNLESVWQMDAAVFARDLSGLGGRAPLAAPEEARGEEGGAALDRNGA